jgi:hypothetical protein
MTVEDLKHREYWTPTEAARVLGRTAAYWRDLLDRKAVTGYRTETKRAQINASSAREYLRSLEAPADELAQARAKATEALREFQRPAQRRSP